MIQPTRVPKGSIPLGYIRARGLAVMDFYLTEKDRAFLALLDRMRDRDIEVSTASLKKISGLSGEEILERMTSLSKCGIIHMKRIDL